MRQKFSPEQIAGRLGVLGVLNISHEAIYLYVWRNKLRGGQLWRDLRQPFKRRKRYRTTENRGWAKGKRHISERPGIVESRSEPGHWEMDTILGSDDQHCVVSLVERATGTVLIGKLRRRNVASLNARVVDLISTHRDLFRTITADNGTEFHGFADIERSTGVPIYFANPYHSWERGTNENTNGLIRQYLPKRTSMRTLTQTACDTIARALNNRPRKRYGFQTPLERLDQLIARRSKPTMHRFDRGL
jgi:IS30 family transposase